MSFLTSSKPKKYRITQRGTYNEFRIEHKDWFGWHPLKTRRDYDGDSYSLIFTSAEGAEKELLDYVEKLQFYQTPYTVVVKEFEFDV